MTFDQLRCPACGVVVRQNHRCHATTLHEPPLEGQDAVNAAREVLRVLHETRRPSGTPSKPIQPKMTFGSDGL